MSVAAPARIRSDRSIVPSASVDRQTVAAPNLHQSITRSEKYALLTIHTSSLLS